jgi:hypothetical protein
MPRISATHLFLSTLTVLLLAGSASAARVAPESAWIPLQEGNRWSYRLSKDSVIRLPGGASQATRSAGSAEEEVTHALGPLAGAGASYELVHRTREKDDATGAEQQRTDTTVVSADMGSVLMHSGESQGTPMEIKRPVTLLPRSPQPGQRWDVGSFVMAGMEFDLRGEVLGFEDVRTPAGDFRRCLKLRFRGRVGGQLDVGGGSVPVEDASFESIEWYAPGVGLVRERANIGLSLRMPDGNRISTQETSERVLEAFQVGGTPAARPR